MALPVYSHPDGGFYVIEEADVMIKMDDGRWEKGLVYRAVTESRHGWKYTGRQLFATTYARWAERFTDTGLKTGGLL